MRWDGGWARVAGGLGGGGGGGGVAHNEKIKSSTVSPDFSFLSVV